MTARDDDVKRWILAGVIDSSTGERIREFEAKRSERHTRSDRPTVPELFVYIAAAITAAGIAVLASTNWEHLTSAARIAIPGIAAAAVLTGGYALRQMRNDALVRGASVSWLLGGALVCGTMAIATAEAGFSEEDVSLAAGVTAGVCSIVLWTFLRTHLQVVGMAGAALLLSMALSTRATEDWAIGVLGALLASFGLAGLIATEMRALVPRSSARLVAGAALVLGGFWAGMPPTPPVGEVVALAVVIFLVATGIRVQSLVYIAFGVLAGFVGLLTLILRHVENATLAGLALIMIGLLLLLAITSLRNRLSWASWGWLSRSPAGTPVIPDGKSNV